MTDWLQLIIFLYLGFQTSTQLISIVRLLSWNFLVSFFFSCIFFFFSATTPATPDPTRRPRESLHQSVFSSADCPHSWTSCISTAMVIVWVRNVISQFLPDIVCLWQPSADINRCNVACLTPTANCYPCLLISSLYKVTKPVNRRCCTCIPPRLIVNGSKNGYIINTDK